jgi:hypothetical protein
VSIAENAVLTPQLIPLSGTGEDFTLGASTGGATSVTVSPGQPAIFTITLGTLGGLTLPVTFTCTSAPAGIPCTFSANPVTPGSNFLITAYTIGPSVGAPRSRQVPPAPPLSPGQRGLWMLALLLAALAWAIARQWNQPGANRWRSAMLPLAAGLLLMLALAGCGGGGTTAYNPGTPPGTYTLTVTGTVTSGSSTLSHVLTLTVNVS